jgi:hypothetical protein
MFANLSGYLTGVLFGFTGVSIGPGDPDTWCDRPVTLPEGWKGIHVDRLWIRGEPWRLHAAAGDRTAALTPSG